MRWLAETSSPGDDFLAGVVSDWEAATAPAQEAGVRVVHVRTGIVQSPRGGTLRLLLPLFEIGLGGRLGSGRQWTSWIGIDDLVDIYHRAVVDQQLSGAVNAVAPDPVRNIDYTAALAGVLRRPRAIPVPASARGCSSGRKAPTSSSRPVNESARNACSPPTIRFGTPGSSQRCAISWVGPSQRGPTDRTVRKGVARRWPQASGRTCSPTAVGLVECRAHHRRHASFAPADTLFDLRLTAEMLDSMRWAIPAARQIGRSEPHANGVHRFDNALVARAEIITSPRACRGGMVRLPPARPGRADADAPNSAR